MLVNQVIDCRWDFVISVYRAQNEVVNFMNKFREIVVGPGLAWSSRWSACNKQETEHATRHPFVGHCRPSWPG